MFEAVLAPSVCWKAPSGKVHTEAERGCQDTESQRGFPGRLRAPSPLHVAQGLLPATGRSHSARRTPRTIGLFNFANEKNNILFEEFGKDPAAITMFCCDYAVTGILGTHSGYCLGDRIYEGKMENTRPLFLQL